MRWFHGLFGLVAYFVFFATFLYLIAFVGNFPFVPITIDRASEAPLAAAIAINIGLIALFGVQHSVMARQGFKRAWTKVVPEPIERSMYVLLASVVLMVLFIFWQTIPGTIWSVTNIFGAYILWTIFGLGWLMVLLSTFLINHFELFGLQQVYRNLRGEGAAPPKFHQPFFYKLVRHPLYTGFLLAFWATPVMTLGHLIFALGMTIYILVAIQYEERDLTKLFGQQYSDYRTKVGMLLPKIR